MKRICGTLVVIAALWAVAPATADHSPGQGPKITPPGAPVPICGLGETLAKIALADPSQPGASDVQFQDFPDPFPPPFCSRAENKLNP